jgi:hypothetical protein
VKRISMATMIISGGAMRWIARGVTSALIVQVAASVVILAALAEGSRPTAWEGIVWVVAIIADVSTIVFWNVAQQARLPRMRRHPGLFGPPPEESPGAAGPPGPAGELARGDTHI